jgi:alpha-tubulin suppressor-like RCC1 family protein
MIGRRNVATPALFSIAAGLALAVGCENETTGPSGLGRLAIEPQNAVLAIDSTLRFMLTAVDVSGDTVDQPEVTWRTSDETVAQVDSSGRATGVGPGVARLSAEWEGLAVDAMVDVAIRFFALSAGESHTCGVTVDSLAFCWGSNESGQLGIGGVGGIESRPTRVALDGHVAAVAAGAQHTCALIGDRTAYCWGENPDGRLGFGLAEDAAVPTPVAGRLLFAEITAGDTHTCGSERLGTAYCWGGNSYGQLGNGSTQNSTVPVQPVGGLVFATITAGGEHSCGTTSELTYCWGNNSDGQLGVGDVGGTQLSPTPTDTTNLVNYGLVKAGRAHTCGGSYCWGDNSFGQVGAPFDSTVVPTPFPVRTIWHDTIFYSDSSVRRVDTIFVGLIDVAVGGDHVCGKVEDDMWSPFYRHYEYSYCWGRNDHGQLGDGTNDNSDLPVKLPRIWSDFALGASHTCALDEEGIAYCWGNGSSGQLGTGDTGNRSSPARVRGQL